MAVIAVTSHMDEKIRPYFIDFPFGILKVTMSPSPPLAAFDIPVRYPGIFQPGLVRSASNSNWDEAGKYSIL